MNESNNQGNTSGLISQTIKGIAWLLGSRAWYQLIHFFVSIILARLLIPEDYGLLGMALVFTNFLITLSDFGLTSAIVQKMEISEEQLSSIFWFDIFVGIGCACILTLASPLIATFYSEPRLTMILGVLSLNFILLNGNVVPFAQAQKTLQFGKITKINAIAVLMSGLISIVAAYFGLKVWALVLQTLSSSLILLFLFWVKSGFRPKFHFRWQDLKGIWQYSINLLGFSVTNYFSRNADYMIVGHFLGSAPLGLYTLAYNLMLFPISNLVGVINQAVFPALAKLQDVPEKIADAYIKSCQYLGFLTIPSMAGLAILSKEAILSIYGPKWLESSSVLSLLCLVAIFQPFTSLVGVVFLARGFTKWLFRWSLVVTPIMIVSFLLGINWGIKGVATGYLIAQVMVLLLGMPIMYKKAGVSVNALLDALKIPALGTLVMAPIVYLIRYYFDIVLGSNYYVTLFVGIFTGVIIYSLTLYLMRGKFWSKVKDDLRIILPQKVSNG